MKPSSYRHNFFLSAVLAPLLLLNSGCIYLAVGGIGAIGGYVVSPDSVEGLLENDMASVWDAALEIVSIMGVVLEEHEDGGILIAKINGAKITVSVIPISESTLRLIVKSRKHHLPKVSTAQDVFVKIVEYLR